MPLLKTGLRSKRDIKKSEILLVISISTVRKCIENGIGRSFLPEKLDDTSNSDQGKQSSVFFPHHRFIMSSEDQTKKYQEVVNHCASSLVWC